MSLNDPQWGRGKSEEDPKKETSDDREVKEPQNEENNQDSQPKRPESAGRRNDGDDLERLWDDFNRALGNMLGQGPQNGQSNDNNTSDTQNENRSDYGRRDQNASFNKDEFRETMERFKKMGGGNMPHAQPSGKGLLFAGVIALGLWGATGFYIVPEGQSGIVTTFGKYTETTMPGFRWHAPVPIQNVEIVDVSSVRTVEVGALGRAAREAEALMLTDDENIVDLRFNVQYRIKPGEGAMNYIFRSRNPDDSVLHSAESAMREVVGRLRMDNVLFESKQEIAEAVKKIMQDMLDRYQTGIEVMSVAIQNAQPPQPVQAAFNDAVKAGQDRERQINEGQAYANAVIPKARGMAVRLTQEAEGYKARVVEAARGDAERFTQILKQYEKAPQVTRDRMYVDVMQQVLSSSTKIFVDSKGSNNLLYLPFDKLMEQNKTQTIQSLQKDMTMESSVNSTASEKPLESMNTSPINQVRDMRTRTR